VPHVKRVSSELKRIKEIITVHTDYFADHPSTFVPHAIYLPINKLTRKTAVIPLKLKFDIYDVLRGSHCELVNWIKLSARFFQ